MLASTFGLMVFFVIAFVVTDFVTMKIVFLEEKNSRMWNFFKMRVKKSMKTIYTVLAVMSIVFTFSLIGAILEAYEIESRIELSQKIEQIQRDIETPSQIVIVNEIPDKKVHLVKM